MRNEQIIFINQIRPVVEKYAKKYGYNANVVDAIVGQACLESNYGKSELSAKYHNYFGMKCGSYWKGKSVNMRTHEEYNVGVISVINDNFRVYDNMDAGVRGYFDFISTSRYQNLKSTTTPAEYLNTIKFDGYATSSSYVDNVMKVVNSLPKNDIKHSNPKVLYEVGKEYTLQDNMIVRTGAGTNCKKVGHNGLTNDGKKHDKDKNGSLDKGTIITCKEVKTTGNGDVWLRCPSGWVAAIYGGTVYIK